MISVHHHHNSAAASKSLPEELLAVFGFGGDDSITNQERYIDTPLRLLSGGAESWCCSGVGYKIHHENGLAIFGTDEVKLGLMRLPVSSLAVSQQTHHAYTAIYRWLSQNPDIHLWRLWNVFPNINEGQGEDENYRKFCRGRMEALEALGATQASSYPAATAIGNDQDELFVLFLAGRAAPTHLENPRQVSSFHYPAQYADFSPTFARATWVPKVNATEVSHEGSLLVSGTASIVGHESQHIGDWRAQLDETLKNISALVTHAEQTLLLNKSLEPSALRLYLRDPAIQDAAASILQTRLGAEVPVIILQGDICRSELLLEMEGVWATNREIA